MPLQWELQHVSRTYAMCKFNSNFLRLCGLTLRYHPLLFPKLPTAGGITARRNNLRCPLCTFSPPPPSCHIPGCGPVDNASYFVTWLKKIVYSPSSTDSKRCRKANNSFTSYHMNPLISRVFLGFSTLFIFPENTACNYFIDLLST